MNNNKDWLEAFKPLESRGMSHREGQSQLGQAIIDGFRKSTHLVCEAPVGTGKSAGYLIPIITEILAGKKKKEFKRAVISSETLALQRQLEVKDVPFLQESYPGFTYKVLRGRTNYFCYDQGSQNAIGDRYINSIVTTLQGRIDSLGDGTKTACEVVLGYTLSDQQWKKICGSTGFCNDNGCTPDKGCFAMAARAAAAVADIVIINHALLQTDIDMKASGGPFADGLLGDYDFLIIDEAHSLADKLIDGWTEKLSEWEIFDMTNSVSKGVTKSASYFPTEVMGYYAAQATEELSDVISSFIKFYGRLNEKTDQDWAGSSTAVSLKYVVGAQDAGFQATMREYEEQNPHRLSVAEGALGHVQKHLEKTLAYMRDNDLKGTREVSKGLRASKKLIELIGILQTAMASKNGIVFQYGVNYGVLVDGWVKRDGTNTCTIRMIPLDISSKASKIWEQADSCVLTSGTLRDPVDNSFAYIKASLGFPEAKELVVDTPFDFRKNQLIYVTPANQRPVEDTVFSMNELVQLIGATKGGTLALCTSKRELKIVADQLRAMHAAGKFPYNIYVQEDGVDKNKLVELFTHDTHSILIGLKSFFVGISIEGESLRHTSFIRFPNERYNVECRMMMEIWAIKGFRDWYAMKSLESFNQGKGRLIRTVTDRGLISILDVRMNDKTSNVYRTAKVGIDASGSYVTQDIGVVKQFMEAAL
jgi:Rad3-related DNA helicase